MIGCGNSYLPAMKPLSIHCGWVHSTLAVEPSLRVAASRTNADPRWSNLLPGNGRIPAPLRQAAVLAASTRSTAVGLATTSVTAESGATVTPLAGLLVSTVSTGASLVCFDSTLVVRPRPFSSCVALATGIVASAGILIVAVGPPVDVGGVVVGALVGLGPVETVTTISAPAAASVPGDGSV